MLPEGWQHIKLGEAFKSSLTKGKSGLPTLSVTITDGLIARDSIDRKMDTSLEAHEHLLVKRDDIAYNMMRMWQGASGLATHDAVVSPAYVVLRAKSNIDPLFASYLFKLPRTIHNFWAYSYGITDDRLRLYFKDFCAIPVNLPPVTEQRRIAQILSTWDKAIAAQEKLVVNARAQKKALMQQLLTGKKRLPGFKGDWKKSRLGEVAEFKSGGTPSKENTAYWGGSFPWVSAKDLKNHYISNAGLGLTELGQAQANIAPVDSILILVRGMTLLKDVPVGVVVRPVAFNQDIKALISKPGISPFFLSYLLVHHKAALRALVNTANHGTGRLDTNLLQGLPIHLPPIAEQHKIAEVLSASDRAIVSQERLAVDAWAQKKALMQQLLTGKRRVTAEDSSAAPENPRLIRHKD